MPMDDSGAPGSGQNNTYNIKLRAYNKHVGASRYRGQKLRSLTNCATRLEVS